MRQFRTATPNLSYRVKSNIIYLQNWIESQSWQLVTRNLYTYRDRYNFNELVDSNLTDDVELYFSYRGRLEDHHMTIKLPYSKVVDIIEVIKSKNFENEAIFKKILLKFTK
jgi:hypothetical protein